MKPRRAFHLNNSGNHSFSLVPSIEGLKRSVFDRSFGNKLSANAGYLYPFFIDEILPGDSVKLKCSVFGRFATLIAPLMDNVYMDTHFFFIPNRLVWTNWEKFCGFQVNPGDSIAYSLPQVSDADTGTGVPEGSLGDYFGLPTKLGTISVNALPFRCYTLTWDEWFRDQNLQNSVSGPLDDTLEYFSFYNLLSRGKRHDYFTSCLPWPQKGTAVTLPLGVRANIKGIGLDASSGTASPSTSLRETGDTSSHVFASGGQYNANGGGILINTTSVGSGPRTPNIYADLTTATAATINDLRNAFQVQKILERDARGGTRYTEILRSHFGVISPDARLQRPEYLGGQYGIPLRVNAVPQTSVTAATPQGNLAATGVVSDVSDVITKSFVEHGYILGLVSIRADLNYQQGLNKMWSRLTRFDFYWPELAHIGEQPVLNKELYFQSGGAAANNQVFGYQEAWADYRFKPSIITGAFRSNSTTSYDMWHLAQKFTSLPTLNGTFISEQPPISRVIAVNTAPAFLLDAHFNYKIARLMPTYSVPGLIDHF